MERVLQSESQELLCLQLDRLKLGYPQVWLMRGTWFVRSTMLPPVLEEPEVEEKLVRSRSDPK